MNINMKECDLNVADMQGAGRLDDISHIQLLELLCGVPEHRKKKNNKTSIGDKRQTTRTGFESSC